MENMDIVLPALFRLAMGGAALLAAAAVMTWVVGRLTR
jgi:hypothetical protein